MPTLSAWHRQLLLRISPGILLDILLDILESVHHLNPWRIV